MTHTRRLDRQPYRALPRKVAEMKKIIVAVLLVALVGCVPRMTPEMQRVSSVSDTSKCRFITMLNIMPQSFEMVGQLKYYTVANGGDSFKIISTANQRIGAMDGFISTTFEIYKCK